MPVMVRGQGSDCGNPLLSLSTRVDGFPIDVAELSFQIFDKTSGSAVQVYPVTGRQALAVDLDCPLGARLEAGQYVASWVVPQNEPLGLHEIRWFLRVSPQSSERDFREDFEVLPQAALLQSEYASIELMRGEGIDEEEISDARLVRKIRAASQLIDRWTGWWFWARPQVITVDGQGGNLLLLDTPIVSISEVRIHGEAVEDGLLFVYNRHLTQRLTNPDDRNSPKLRFGSGGVFREGSQNVRIAGRFGYTDYDGTPEGKTPDAITDACMALVVRDLAKLGDPDARDEARNRSRVVSLRTRDQEISWANPGAGSGVGTRGTGAWSGDPAIDNIIASYRRPPSLGSV